jgi:hypothetical protein
MFSAFFNLIKTKVQNIAFRWLLNDRQRKYLLNASYRSTFKNNDDAFKRLFYRQMLWQEKLFQRINKTPVRPDEYDHIVDINLYNAIEEIIEARRHISVRKYWNPSKAELPMDAQTQDLCAEEIIDVFHFLMTALIYMDFTYEDIQSILTTKMEFNDNRSDHQETK